MLGLEDMLELPLAETLDEIDGLALTLLDSDADGLADTDELIELDKLDEIDGLADRLELILGDALTEDD